MLCVFAQGRSRRRDGGEEDRKTNLKLPTAHRIDQSLKRAGLRLGFCTISQLAVSSKACLPHPYLPRYSTSTTLTQS